jgi:hypothetical protein
MGWLWPTLPQTTLVIHDGNVIRLASCLIGSRDVEDVAGINVGGDLDLRNTSRRRQDTREFAQLLSLVRARARSYTWISIAGCLSKRARLHRDGGVRLMRAVVPPPAVSTPSDRGATTLMRPSVFLDVSLERMAAQWTAAP